MPRHRAHGEGNIRKRKDGRWEARLMVGYKPDGKPDVRSVYGQTKEEVAQALLELRQQRVDGTLPVASTTTLAEFVANWFPYHEQFGNGGQGCRENTMANYRRSWRHIEPILGKMRLKDIRPEHLRLAYQKIMSAVQQQSGGAKDGRRTTEQCHRFLHLVFEQALEDGLIARNPCKMLRDKPRSRSKSPDIITIDQARAVLELAKQTVYYPLFLLLTVTGARRNEILGLQWKHVDLLNCRVSITQQVLFPAGGGWKLGPPKSKSGERDVPIPEDVAEALLDYKNRVNPSEEDFVCQTKNGNPIRPESLNNAWIKIRRKLDLGDHVTIHSLRHSYITWQAEAGTDMKTVAMLVGHADDRTTRQIYQRVTPKLEETAVRVVAGLIKPSLQQG